MERYSPTFYRTTAIARACVSTARAAGLPDGEIVDGILDGSLLWRIQQRGQWQDRQLVLAGTIGPAFQPHHVE